MFPNLWIIVAVFVIEVHVGFCAVFQGEHNAVDSKRDDSFVNNAENRTRDGMMGILSDFLGIDEPDRNETLVEESRKKRDKNKEDDEDDKGFLEKAMPMMAIPFLVSSSMIPMMMASIFFMLVKSAFVGKIGLILLLINMFRNRSNQGGVYTHNIQARGDDDTRAAMDHYGYHGDEEYGAYVNRRKKRAREIS